MNTVSNSSAISFRSFLLIPFVTLLIFGFSNRNVQIVGHAEKSSLETGLDPISAQIEIQDTIPKASDRELVEYNRLAKKFNQQDDTKYIRIRKVDVDRLNVLYSRMSPAQRKVNEPYPDFPEPPIPPAPPKAPSPNHLKPPTPPQPPAAPAANPSDGPPAPPAPADPPSAPSPPEPPMPNAGEYDAQRHALKEEARKLKRQLEMNEKQANALAKKQKALESQQKQLIKEQKEKLKELKLQQEETYQQLQDAQRHHVKQSVRVSETPQSARENILKMTKLNAKFIHEGKEITSDEALELVGKNQSIQIKSKSVSGERPVVKLTTKK